MKFQLGDIPRVQNGKVGDGIAGNYDTLRIMRKIAHDRKKMPIVRTLALKILNDCRVNSMDYFREAYCLAQFVQNHVRYVRDPVGVELLTDPVTMIDMIQKGKAQGDCDDMSLLLATLLLSIGIQPYFRIVKYHKDSPTFNHIYVVAYEKNRGMKQRLRLPMETIVKDREIGFEVQHVYGEEHKV